MNNRIAAFLGLGATGFAALAAVAAPRAGVAPRPVRTEVALFAGGCFWSMEKLFESTPGVVEAVSGFAGGRVRNPSYEQVSHGSTGHRETVRVIYDPSKITYAKLAERYLHAIDPTDAGGAFCDRGEEYRSGIFTLNAQQRATAEVELARLNTVPRFRGKVAVQLLPAAQFYAAEGYHQDYWRKNPIHYNGYRIGCGRDAALARVWGDDAAKASKHG